MARGSPDCTIAVTSSSTGANPGTDAGVQCTKMPSFASRHHAGTSWRRSVRRIGSRVAIGVAFVRGHTVGRFGTLVPDDGVGAVARARLTRDGRRRRVPHLCLLGGAGDRTPPESAARVHHVPTAKLVPPFPHRRGAPVSPKPKPKSPPASKARAAGGKQASPSKSKPAPGRPSPGRAATATKPRFPMAWVVAGVVLVTIVAI